MRDPGPVRARDTVAAVLAGGLGTRLSSSVPDLPKVLAPVGGTPFLSYVLDWLIAAGIGKAVLCVGHMAEKVSAHYGRAYRGLRLSYSREEEPLGTAGALALAGPMLDSPQVLALNGDSLCLFEAAPFFEAYGRRRPAGLIALVKKRDAGRFGRVELDESGGVRAFREKGGGAGLVSAGVYLVSNTMLQEIPRGRPCSLEREVFPRLCDGSLLGFETAAPFIDIGTPRSYGRAERFFREARRGHF